MSAVETVAALMVYRLLAVSLLGAVLAGAVWVVCRHHPGMQPAVRRWLWWAVSFVLLVGLLPLPSFELAVLPAAVVELRDDSGLDLSPPAPGNAARPHDHAAKATRPSAPAPAPQVFEGDPAIAAVVGSGAEAGGGVRSSATALVSRLAASGRWPVTVLVGLWAAGALLALGGALRDLARVRRLVRASLPADDPSLQQRFARLAAALGVPATRLRLSPQVETPQVVGALRPVVLLPADAGSRFAAEELELTLAHELLHVRHRDLLLGYVPALADRLFFFHPLAALAVREHALAREAACDAAVLRRLAPSPRAYGRLLLKLSLVPQSPLPAAMAVVTQRTLHRRLQMLLDSPRRPRATWAWLALPAVFALVLPLRLTAADETAAVTPAELAAPAPAPLAAPPVAPTMPAVVAQALPAPAATLATASPAAPRREVSGWESGRTRWVLFQGDSTSSHGSSDDIHAARRWRRGGETLLWVRADGEEWLIRDPQVLAALEAAMGPQRELGRRQAELGRRQAELGAQQAELGAQQAELGSRQAEFGQRQAELGSQQAAAAARVARLAAEEATLASRQHSANDAAARREIERERAALEEARRPLEEEMRRLGDEQRRLRREEGALGGQQGELGSRQGELGARQGELGSRQGELGARQGEAARELERVVARLVADAVRDGKAERVRE